MLLSVNINGTLQSLFGYSRGAGQGDMFSMLLFCLVKDVLSRRILQLVASHKLELIVGLKNIIVPSHILYGDDVLIFCKGQIYNIKNFISTFKDYAVVSGQIVNCG